MNRIKQQLIKQLISIRKPRWKDGHQLKVVIALNKYFTQERWNSILLDCLGEEIDSWDVVFCHNKIDIYRHATNADICFIFSLGQQIINKRCTPKLIYFPLIGLDFLENRIFPDNCTIEQPPPFSAQSIAEYCIAMSITLIRNLHLSFNNRFLKQWEQTNIIPHSIVSITRCKIGVLGLGKIGKVVAANFRNIGCEVIGCDTISPQNNGSLSDFYTSDRLYDFIEKIDILIISLSLNKSTKNIIDHRVLQLLGRHKYLINISRGEIIDENALIHALSTNMIKGAALDVFYNEPLPRNSRLYQCKNVIITPHIAGNINLFVTEIQQDFICKALSYSKNV